MHWTHSISYLFGGAFLSNAIPRPRWALAIGAASGLLATAVCIAYLIRFRNLRLHHEHGRLRLSLDAATPEPLAAR